MFTHWRQTYIFISQSPSFLSKRFNIFRMFICSISDFYWMRPEAVAPPPLGILPGLLGGGWGFAEDARWLHLFFAYFLLNLWRFCARILHGRRAKRWPKLIPEIELKIEKSLKRESKSLKKPKKWCPGTLQKWSWEQVGAMQSAREFSETIFGATWVILGGILRPAGRQGAPQIKLLGIKSH